MKSWIPFLACAVLSPNFAAAQSIVFQDGFENGLGQWTTTGYWNLENSSDACGSQAAPFPEGTNAAWFGLPPNCNFDVQWLAPFGNLELTPWITLPTDAASVSLYFKSYVDSEYCWGWWDVHEFQLIAQGGPNNGYTDLLCSTIGPEQALLTWHERRVDLTAYRGAQVRFSFHFSAGDTGVNDGLGWLIDDVRVVAEPGQPICPSSTFNNTCPCNPAFAVGGGCFNALGKSATLFSSGTASVASDTLSFHAAEMMPGTAGTLFQATGATNPFTAFGDGLLCVTGSLTRLGTQFAPTGAADWPLASLGSLSTAGFVPPGGGDFYYQVIYRDATPGFCTIATFNLTSAQRMTWTP